MAATTECTKKERSMQCECQPGFRFDMEQCRSHPTCYIPMEMTSYCFCPNLEASSTVYCEEPLTLPGNITLSPNPATVGSDIVLEFSSVDDVTNIKWFLANVLSNMMMEVHNGTRATVVTSRRKSTLSIKNIPRHWAGLYVCRFDYRSLHWQTTHLVEFPLSSSDIALNPPNVFVWNNATSFPGITVECCIQDDGRSYYVFWEPGHVISDGVYRGVWLCYPLSIHQIPEKDTDYRCVFRDDMGSDVESRVHVAIIKDTDRICSDDRDNRWKVTKAGFNAEILCASGKTGKITRSCLRNGQWATPNYSCVDIRLQTLFQQAQRFSGGLGIPKSDIPLMMGRLRNYTMSSLNYISHPSDMITVVKTIKMIAVTAVDNNMMLRTATMTDLAAVCSQLLSFDFETFWTPALTKEPSLGSMFLQSVESISGLFEPDLNTFTLIQPNVQISTVVLNPLAWTDYNISFNMTSNISLVIKNIALRNRSNFTVINIMVLRNLGNILPFNFGDSVKGYGHRVGRYVVVTTIRTGNQTVTQANLDMALIRRWEPNRTDIATAQCVFWNNNLFEGVGGWSTEGCRTIIVNNSVVCRYRQLAPVSVLMSRGVFEEDFEDDALETLSQVGASLSIISLLICFTVYIIEWKQTVKDDITYYRQVTLINISVSMFLGDVWFLVSTSITRSHTNELCVSAAFFQHFFYLATLFWMLIQGFILLYELVFSDLQLNKIAVLLAMVGIGYICPLIISSVTIGIDYPKEEYVTDGGCFLTREDGAVFAFSVPVLLTVALNFFPISAMIWNLLRPPATEEPEEEEDTKSLVAKALAILTSVFGTTWFLETLLEEVHESFEYILTFFNSFQGVIILIFGCLMDKRIREALSKRFQKLQAVFPSLSCCEHDSYDVEQISAPEPTAIYRHIVRS